MEEAKLWGLWVIPVAILYKLEVADMSFGFGAVFQAAVGLDLLMIAYFQVMVFSV